MTPPPPLPAGQVSAALSAQLQGIAMDVVYDNRGATAQEQAEIARHAAKVAASAPEKAVPPAFGGGLAHQSSAGLNFLAMAKELNGIVAEIQEQAARMNTVGVTDTTGAQLYQFSVGVGVRDLLRHFGLSSGLQQAHDFYQPLTEALKQAHADALTALVRSLQGTASWTHMQITSRQLGGHPLMGSVDKIATQLTDEGLMDYVKAMARYAYQFQQTPDAAALVTFAHLDGILKVPLNQWAQNGGDLERTCVEAVGIIMFGLQAGSIAGSAAVDQGAAKRLVGQLTGTILSASYGSEDARNSLKEMIPLWSWNTLNNEAIQLETDAGDYYGAGKKIGELLVTIIGDATALIPVVKGTAIALKASGNVLKATLTQALKKTGTDTFKVEIKALADDASQLVRRCAEGIRCFPAGTRVLLADGRSQPIEQMREGDLVMADDPTDARPATARSVTQVLQHWTQSLVAVATDADHDGQPDGNFEATPNHPIWAGARGWVLAGDLQPGDELRDAQGAAVAVLSTRTFNQTCATYNLGVAEDHSFLVLSGATPVLVHNINPGPRAWVIYRATKIINGVEHAYVGKASMPSDSKNFKPDDVFKYRYSETKGVLVRSNITATSGQVDYLHMFWEEGLPSGMTGSNGRMKSYGEVVAQALEAYEEFKFRENGQSLNTNRPLDPNKPFFDDILDLGESFLQNRNGGLPCAGIHRPH